jgi:hypothetical protein
MNDESWWNKKSIFKSTSKPYDDDLLYFLKYVCLYLINHKSVLKGGLQKRINFRDETESHLELKRRLVYVTADSCE